MIIILEVVDREGRVKEYRDPFDVSYDGVPIALPAVGDSIDVGGEIIRVSSRLWSGPGPHGIRTLRIRAAE